MGGANICICNTRPAAAARPIFLLSPSFPFKDFTSSCLAHERSPSKSHLPDQITTAGRGTLISLQVPGLINAAIFLHFTNASIVLCDLGESLIFVH